MPENLRKGLGKEKIVRKGKNSEKMTLLVIGQIYGICTVKKKKRLPAALERTLHIVEIWGYAEDFPW